MNEEFLQYTWKHGLFDKINLKTIAGQNVEILNPGKWNTDSGPDFFNASVKIDNTVWAGNVEVHIKSSDWIKHKHQNNEAYNSVILHVVNTNNKHISLPNGNPLPTIVIEPNKNASKNYEQLITKQNKPACNNFLNNIDKVYIRAAIDAMLVDRLKLKTDSILHTLANTKNNWNETFFRHLAINFGFKINAFPFDLFARSISLQIVAKHTQNIQQLEAIFFGQSGLLNEQLLGDNYFLMLRDEYSFLAKKYNLKGIESHHWKFMRLRPANFPTVRIAQLAALYSQSEALFSKLIETEKQNEIKKLFEVKASPYWDTHYRFNQTAPKKTKWIGESSRNNILINTVVPFLYIYGERNNKPQLKQRAFDLLENIPPEKNRIISLWQQIGIDAENAYDSQALIQLKNHFCDKKKCLHCKIGARIITRAK